MKTKANAAKLLGLCVVAVLCVMFQGAYAGGQGKIVKEIGYYSVYQDWRCSIGNPIIQSEMTVG